MRYSERHSYESTPSDSSGNHKFRNTLRIALTALALSCALIAGQSSDLRANGFSIARSAGMAGAYTGLASGVAAAYYNPANLGLASHRQSELSLAGMGLNVSNNSFTLEDYNKYTGATLSTSDKQDILDKVPVDGLILSADAEVSASGFSQGQFALTFTARGAGEANLGYDLLDVLLNGNTLGDTVSLNGMYGSGWSYLSASFSFGAPVYTLGTRQLALGATFHYLRGLYYGEVTRAEGGAVTLTTGFAGDGAVVLQSAEGGSGYAIDLGASLQLNRNYTVGLSINNFVSSIKWTDNVEERSYYFSFDSVNIDNSGDTSVVVSGDTTIALASVTSHSPSTLTLGIAKTTGKLIWAVDWKQGFKRAPGSSTTPQIALGAEYSLLRFLPLRAGFSTGGSQGSFMAFGSGLKLSFFHLDFAVLTNGGGINSSGSKGLRLAASTGLRF